jgi:adenosylcobinamide-phosphate synthase
MAGALGVQLGGIKYYDGVPVAHDMLGDSREKLGPHSIRHAVAMMWMASLLALAVALWVRG